MKIARLIKKHRGKKLMLQSELANYLNVSFNEIELWESGKTIPNVEMVLKVCEILKIDTNKIKLTDLFPKTH